MNMPRRNDNPALRREYMDANPRCELGPFRRRVLGVTTCHGDGSECHHILGGSSRVDVWSNFLHACWECHRWETANPVEGRLVSCLVKFSKGELDPTMRTPNNSILGGWLANNRPHDERLVPLWEQMVEELRV